MHRSTRLFLALPLAVALAACSSGNPNPDTPKPEGTATFQPTVPAGTPIYVNRGGMWIPASVVRQTGATNVLIHYENMPADWDEDVPFDRVRSRPASATPAAAADFKPGEAVLVTVQSRTVLAEVQSQLDGSTFHVHYQGYGPEAVQDVPAAQIQRPFAGVTAFAPGAAVHVEIGAPQPYPAKVLAAIAADKWLVRLDNAGPQYDQVVDAQHIRPAEAAPVVTAPPVSTAPAPTASVDPGKKAPVLDKTPAAPAPLKAGDNVVVFVRSVYYPGKIVGAGAAANSFKVRLEGASADEEATADHVARLEEPLKNVKYKTGQAVFVEWHGVYAPGKVVKEMANATYMIRADGKGAESDELVPVKRLRPR